MTLLEVPTLVSPLTVVNALLDRVESALVACNAAPITRKYPAAGLVAWDDCCGMLVAAPERIYRTASFPTEGPDENGCFDGFIALDCVTQLVRCISVMDDAGNPPSAQTLDDEYSMILLEGGIIWNALGEGFEGWESTNLSQAYIGAEGGCIGIETRITVGVDEEEFCPGC